MDRFRKSLILIVVIAVPAAAHSTFAPSDDLCFASGTATYRLSPKAAAPDYRVKIDNDAPRPDLRMALVDRPEIADFVLADDFGAAPGNACRSSVRVRTIKVDNETRACIRCATRTRTSRPCWRCSGRRASRSSSRRTIKPIAQTRAPPLALRQP